MNVDQYHSPSPFTGPDTETRSFRDLAMAILSGSAHDRLPSFETPTPTIYLRDRSQALARLRIGSRLGDFELLRELGAGAFGRVYLARQLSLDRMVALKVTAERSGEARALAALEHDHIVRVFGEEMDVDEGLHLLAMQYVPGTNLAHVLDALREEGKTEWTGRDLLDAVAGCETGQFPMNPATLRDRDFLSRCDHVEAVCWLGARLAEALDHAHRLSILHRDVKPSNVLLNGNGRVLLTDFNLATVPHKDVTQLFGGTLGYMAPEHLDALNPFVRSSRDAVDARSDIYSLGVVLFEMLTGRTPFSGVPEEGGAAGEAMKALAEERRGVTLSVRRFLPEIPPVLERVVRRCLDPDPQRRYQRAEELSRVLDGCGRLRQWERGFPRPSPITRAAHAAPVLTFIFLAALPQVLGTLVNIAYNAFAIVQNLSLHQQEMFQRTIMAYNALVYPVCIWVFCRSLVPVTWARRRLEEGEPLKEEDATEYRRRALATPRLVVYLACAGWLPGGVVFPLVIHLAAGPVAGGVFLHFVVSFAISGLVATTYSYFGMQAFVLRVLYPRLWVDPQGPRVVARLELSRIERRLRVFQFFAGLIPLSGAMLLFSVGQQHQQTLTFQLLVVGLIGLGTAGFGASLLLTNRASQTLSVMLGSDRS